MPKSLATAPGNLKLNYAGNRKQTGTNPSLLAHLADCVDAHILFEERELFPHLEKVLSEPELKSIGAALEQSHATPVTDDFADAFWMK